MQVISPALTGLDMTVNAHHCDLIEELREAGEGAEAQFAKRAEAPKAEEPKPAAEASDVSSEGTDPTH